MKVQKWQIFPEGFFLESPLVAHLLGIFVYNQERDLEIRFSIHICWFRRFEQLLIENSLLSD